jgi:replicative superfamily II helicase
MFRGIFIGIDRYQSWKINWLSCAKRDATALHALFTDTLGGQAVLLTDQDATRAEIERQCNALATCDQDDVVVLFFSGHGSETHELVTYNADTIDLAGSCIPLATLTDWFSRIPAKRLICILDCCFSGGMGAKVLQVETKSKDLRSTDDLIKELSGESRLIFTASLGTEEAWENQRLGHGLLTYYLLEALQGADEVREAGKIDIYKLLSWVTKRVKDAASKLGKVQTPTMSGRIVGELTWPIFQAGSLYTTVFPERVKRSVTSDVQSLSAYGFPPPLLAAWAGSIPSLNQLQIDAINEYGLLYGEHLVVSAPTSSGKTMIGELAALRGVINRRRAFFLLPLKALVNDKHKHFTNTYASFGLKVIRATGDHSDDIPALMRGQYDICLMTYEKFSALALGTPHILEQVGTVVVDEVQMIADETRGVNLEFVLTLLLMRRKQGAEPQLIALSAVIGDTNGLERWLGARLLRRDERPVPLNEGVITADGSFRFLDASLEEKITPSYIQRQYRKGSTQDWIIPLVQKLVAQGKQVIMFRETRGEARYCALYLARELGLPPVQSALDALPMGDLSKSSSSLHTALAGGVAFHISDLDPEERRIVEESFRERGTQLRVIAATTTLAMGINTPADAVIIAGLEHPGNKPYSIAEYKNIVGRAGRLGYAKEGSTFLMATTGQEEYYYWNHFVLGKPEDLHSRFLASETDPRSLILRVLVASQQSAKKGMTSDEIADFLEESFGAYQEKQASQQWTWDVHSTSAMLSQLKQHQLVHESGTGIFKLTKLGWLAGQSGLEVESVIRIVAALSPISSAEITDPALLCVSQITVELDKILFPINKRSTQKEPQVWGSELQRQNIPHSVLSSLYNAVTDQLQSTLRAKKTVASLLWITDKPLAEIETIMTQFGGGLDGAAGPIRSLRSRICDVLPTVASIAEFLHPDLDLTEQVRKLLIRLEFGIPAIAVDLAAQTGNALARGDYQNLIQAGLASIEAIEKSADGTLLACLNQAQEKVSLVREAVVKYKENTANPISVPILPEYKG